MVTRKQFRSKLKDCIITKKAYLHTFITYLFLLSLTGCYGPREDEEAQLNLEKASFSELEGWSQDNLKQALPALKETCAAFAKMPAEKTLKFAGKVKDWHPFCKALNEEETWDNDDLRDLFQSHFDVYQITNNGNKKGMFTGYFEPTLAGSPTRSEKYHYPIYQTPSDIFFIDDLGTFIPDLKGKKIAARIQGDQLIPYHDRQSIDQHQVLANKSYELVWVSSAIDAFFLHIQGSGIVRFEDGTHLRIGYARQNGHPYKAIGKILIEKGEIPLEEMSMQRLKKWLKENPDRAEEILYQNPSYIFFRILAGKGPLGSMGVPLTPHRSLAVDRKFLPLGIPIWLQTEAPVEGIDPLQQLMLAQDTGGAITGPVRGDVFWGPGEEAAHIAGHMRAEGQYYALLPKNLKIVA